MVLTTTATQSYSTGAHDGVLWRRMVWPMEHQFHHKHERALYRKRKQLGAVNTHVEYGAQRGQRSSLSGDSCPCPRSCYVGPNYQLTHLLRVADCSRAMLLSRTVLRKQLITTHLRVHVFGDLVWSCAVSFSCVLSHFLLSS